MEQNEIILSLRKKRGLTLEQLSSETGISTNMLWHLEKGDRTGTIETLKKLSNFYEVPLDYITANSAFSTDDYIRNLLREHIVKEAVKRGILIDENNNPFNGDNLPEDVKNKFLAFISEIIYK